MLDQNTDRMWYVIGAVLVGAAIILIANGTMPQMFASVTDYFSDTISIAENDLNMLNGLPDGLRAYGNVGLDFVEYPDVIRLNTNRDKGKRNDGIYFDTSRYDANSTYELSFQFKRTDGTLTNMNGHSRHFWGDTTYYLDGDLQGSWHSVNDSSNQNINDDEVHDVRVIVRTGDDDLRKVESIDYNNHLHIQPNRQNLIDDVVVEIYNLTFVKVE